MTTQPKLHPPSFRRALVVDDDDLVRRGLRRALGRALGDEAVVDGAQSLRDGLERLQPGVELLVVDLHLGDGSGVELVRAAARLKGGPPVVVAVSGQAGPADAFSFGRFGAVAFLEKPCSAKLILAAAAASLAQPPDLSLFLRGAVGRRPLEAVIDEAREVMLSTALERADGNKTRAAELLGVTRQSLQKMVRRRGR